MTPLVSNTATAATQSHSNHILTQASPVPQRGYSDHTITYSNGAPLSEYASRISVVESVNPSLRYATPPRPFSNSISNPYYNPNPNPNRTHNTYTNHYYENSNPPTGHISPAVALSSSAATAQMAIPTSRLDLRLVRTTTTTMTHTLHKHTVHPHKMTTTLTTTRNRWLPYAPHTIPSCYPNQIDTVPYPDAWPQT